MATAEFQVTGMSCGHCEGAIRSELGEIAGIENIDVSAASGRLVVTRADTVTDEQIIAAVDEAGYAATRV